MNSILSREFQKEFSNELKNIEFLQVINEGSHGIVYAAELDERPVAIKMIKRLPLVRGLPASMPMRLEREVETLRLLKPHQNWQIIRLFLVLAYKDEALLVMEKMEISLQQFLDETSCMLKDTFVFDIVIKVSSGLKSIHSQSILHRDLKPGNILLSKDLKQVKICDFGLARLHSNIGNLTPGVCTRWYRAPELLLGSSEYDFSIDIWSLGCIYSQLVTRKSPFTGGTDIEQLCLIFEALGTPPLEVSTYLAITERTNAKIYQKYPDYSKIEFTFTRGTGISVPHKHASLITAMLSLDPGKRPYPRDIIKNLNANANTERNLPAIDIK